MAFIETPRFPDEIAAWAVGGRGFQTITTDTYGGFEYRNAAWSQRRGAWDVADALREINPNATYAFKTFRNFVVNCYGQLNGFRFKDFQDWWDEGQGIFVQLTSTTFQMYKAYAVSPVTYNQKIQKPVSGTVVVTGGVSPVVNYTTGVVTVASGTPTAWTGQFDVPCRLADDMPQFGLDDSGALYAWQSLKVMEIRLP